AKFFNQMLWWLRGQRQMKNLPPQMYPSVLAQIYKQSTGKPLDLTETVCVPMSGSTESLNAGVAAAILMYESMRQRAAGASA
ncbi:MAG: hypothetical protein IKN20_08690, partial [Firmicutes bacterium]|nr:hypothetical protein [Bacillota bacterium]